MLYSLCPAERTVLRKGFRLLWIERLSLVYVQTSHRHVGMTPPLPGTQGCAALRGLLLNGFSNSFHSAILISGASATGTSRQPRSRRLWPGKSPERGVTVS